MITEAFVARITSNIGKPSTKLNPPMVSWYQQHLGRSLA